jgi:hypothetical protein
VGLTTRSKSLIPDFAKQRPDPQRIVLAAYSAPRGRKNNCQSGLNAESFNRNTPKGDDFGDPYPPNGKFRFKNPSRFWNEKQQPLILK